MKKTLLLLSILAYSIVVKSQTKSSPSLLETISWIKEKLETNTYYNVENVKLERIVSFNNLTKILTIEESNFYTPQGKSRVTTEIPLSKMNPSSILIDKGTDKWNVFHLILRTSSGTKDIKNTVYYYYNDHQSLIYTSEALIFIAKAALLENLDTRLKDCIFTRN